MYMNATLMPIQTRNVDPFLEYGLGFERHKGSLQAGFGMVTDINRSEITLASSFLMNP